MGNPDEKYLSVLKQYFGYDSFRDHQLDIIKQLVENKKDLCITMFTGAGKSLCYQFPPIYTGRTSLIISPLLSLMADQQMKMDALKIPSCCLNSTVGNKIQLKKEILSNKYRLIYTTPEYLITQYDFIQELSEKNILMSVCVDESHVVSMWSQDFREAYKKLDCLKDWLPTVPIMALTATATQKVQEDIIKILKLNKPVIIKTTFNRPNLIINVIPKTTNMVKDVMSAMNTTDSTICLLYTSPSPRD